MEENRQTSNSTTESISSDLNDNELYGSTLAFQDLTFDKKLDIRAIQRTFEGAYIRTALGQLSFAMVILKVFSKDFVLVGTTYTIHGILILIAATRSRDELNRVLLWEPSSSELLHHQYPHYASGIGSEVESSGDSTSTATATGAVTPWTVVNNRLVVTEASSLLPETQSPPGREYYVTGGSTIMFLGILSMVNYIVLFYLLYRMN
ncbi:hypothetical protein NADFUDRAFT_53198 [Nadsonia fulvescens var. elongata DSM 6958]|uniref:DUF202 domain-containing protein n=1 Tax=Nadsonia fulvescens var. elongata DSM 6958 TaxID=857566 RepID=A0A1E3PF09_9ASCO|nr:hypothetical protein NADFUDRAFT_53198 [Nadsonia fulvescens var. elongata DSM 6958]